MWKRYVVFHIFFTNVSHQSLNSNYMYTKSIYISTVDQATQVDLLRNAIEHKEELRKLRTGTAMQKSVITSSPVHGK